MDNAKKLKTLLKLEDSVPLDEESRIAWLIPGTKTKHRIYGPAVTYFSKDSGKVVAEEWWVNGKRHREGEPAIITVGGRKQYYQQGKLHRMDGPAILVPCVGGSYYIRGKSIRVDEYQEHVYRYKRFVQYLQSKDFKNNPNLK